MGKKLILILVVLAVFLLGVMTGIIIRASKHQPVVETPQEILTLSADHYELRSQHVVFGLPEVVDNRYDFQPLFSPDKINGISLLVREGFLDLYSDSYKLPICVCMHWTRDLYEASEELSDSQRDFAEDEELPAYARARKSYGTFGQDYDRGHMARNKDNGAWGDDNMLMGDRMSNIAPQRPHLNRHIWLALENAHRRAVLKDTVRELWVYSGALVDTSVPTKQMTNGICIPYATYKVVSWYDTKGEFHVRAFLMPQEAEDKNLAAYIVSVDEIEERAGLNFFPKLDNKLQEKLEAEKLRALW